MVLEILHSRASKNVTFIESFSNWYGDSFGLYARNRLEIESCESSCTYLLTRFGYRLIPRSVEFFFRNHIYWISLLERSKSE